MALFSRKNIKKSAQRALIDLLDNGGVYTRYGIYHSYTVETVMYFIPWLINKIEEEDLDINEVCNYLKRNAPREFCVEHLKFSYDKIKWFCADLAKIIETEL